jgi:hypothetical protein
MAVDLMFSINKVYLNATETPKAQQTAGNEWTDLGDTKGGANFSQSVDKIEITDDQNTDPIAIIPTAAPKTATINVINASPENLALAFAGDVIGDDVTIPSLIEGVERALIIQTREINGTHYEIYIPRAYITGESEISLSPDDATTLTLNIQVLKPSSGDPVTITKVTTGYVDYSATAL